MYGGCVMVLVSVDGVREVSARIFSAAGMPVDMAEQLAQWLVTSNLSGHPSHGIQRVPEYVQAIREGSMVPAARPYVVSETPTTILLDGQCGPGHFAAAELTRRLAAKCQESQIAMGGIVNPTHIGRLGEWAELATDLGVILYISLGSDALRRGVTATYGSSEGRISTNPISFGAPGVDGDRFVSDFATSAAAEGKIRVARDSGKAVPEGWIRDSKGQPTTDPNDFYDGGILMTFGEHKGSAIAVMTTLLSVGLIGSAVDASGEAWGVFAFAIDPNVFGQGEVARSAIQRQLDAIRSTAPADGFDRVQVPGDFEHLSREALANGPLEIPDTTWELLLDAAASVDVPRSAVDAVQVV